jgi:Flp pilus assembly protein TadG
MRPRLHTRLAKSESAAVAPTVALSLFGLLAVGGIAFDYARMATMDTELQAAADQAALAAASQLDGKTGTCSRAAHAAVNLVANQTLFANEANSTTAITVDLETDCDATGKIRFWKDKAKTAAATKDEEAKFVEVTVNSRTARFALTPVVAALNSGAIGATAFAGLTSAICKVPPLMLCNPSEPSGNINKDYPFDANGLKGVGVKLVSGSFTAPGDFGFLQTGFGDGAKNLAKALGYDTLSADCAPITGVTTEPGEKDPVRNALNTRFDITTNGANTCPDSGTCSPARNVRKDLVHEAGSCDIGGKGWDVSANPYRPPSAGPITSSYPDVMGHPRDYCHAVKKSLQSCGVLGNGQWDRNAYFYVNYGWADQAAWTSATGLPSDVSRYEVYKWEMNHPSVGSPAKGIDIDQSVSGAKKAQAYAVCRPNPVTPNATTPDRRRLSVAVLNCDALDLNGKAADQQVLKWIDVFLVEPSFQRGNGPDTYTDDKDIYVEIIGETLSGSAGTTAGQVVRRDVPYLIE